ncbi:prepilin-type N-terminal cleavage/methylation domain-containing protein [Aromatoleum buckelii]|uniref:Prepilin-type N-terminal cleavage/methylation domain-containing protein n=1 Tax=Aromatoleum buckelii TaxID=200254 RepID=A0ABX1N474_9RHOO|nr:prepilin-type N-terminal cleavage/methylation domain-containing protein [Aromatoleum buckelii]MCK0511881.1 prepilin-type N-terminal cleavage/methylation domain-containing protein [Aromatoleum buckelii]
MGKLIVRRRNPRNSGFTLVEVVVALTLLSLVLLGLVGALRNFGQTSVRLEAQTLAADDLRLVSGLLQRTMARTSSRTWKDPSTQAVRTWFAGGPEGLVWLGHLPVRHGVGGLNHLRLFVSNTRSPSDERRYLALQLTPYAGDDSPPDWGALESLVLLDDIESLQLQYQSLGETGWLDVWDEPAVLPGFVRVMITVRGRSWPPLVVRLEQAELQPESQTVAKPAVRRK